MSSALIRRKTTIDSGDGHLCNIKTTTEEAENQFPVRNPVIKAPSSRRTRSFCSSSSFSSCSSSMNSPLSPTTPLQYAGVPFSWEEQPGVPKHCSSSNFKNSSTDLLRRPPHFSKDSTDDQERALDLLPRPPAAPSSSNSSQRFNRDSFFPIWKKNLQENAYDPFVAALMECSKDGTVENCWKSRKVCKTVSARFSFTDLYSSCKKSSSVSDSKVFLRRSSRTAYNLLNNRSV